MEQKGRFGGFSVRNSAKFALKMKSWSAGIWPPGPTAFGNLGRGKNGCCLAIKLRSSGDLSCHRVEDVNWRFSGFRFGEIRELS